MAIDRTQQVLGIANTMVTKCTTLMNVLSDLEDLAEQADTSLIDFTTYDADFAANESLKHADGALFNKLKNHLFSSTGFRDYIETELSGADTFEEVLYRVSR